METLALVLLAISALGVAGIFFYIAHDDKDKRKITH